MQNVGLQDVERLPETFFELLNLQGLWLISLIFLCSTHCRFKFLLGTWHISFQSESEAVKLPGWSENQEVPLHCGMKRVYHGSNLKVVMFFFVTTHCLYQNKAFCRWKEDVPAVERHPCRFMFVIVTERAHFLFEIMSQVTTLASWLHDNVATEAQQAHFEPSWTLAFGACLWLQPLLLRFQTCSNNLLENCQAAVQHVQRQARQGDIQHSCEKRIKLQKEMRSMSALTAILVMWCDVLPDFFTSAISKNLDGSRDYMAQKIQLLIHFSWLHKLRNRYLFEKVHSWGIHSSHTSHTEGDSCTTMQSKSFLPEIK